MNPLFAAALCIALLFAAATDYVPAFIDADGRVFGLFKLDIYKDALHVASASGRRRRVSRAARRPCFSAYSGRSISSMASWAWHRLGLSGSQHLPPGRSHNPQWSNSCPASRISGWACSESSPDGCRPSTRSRQTA